MKKVAPLPLPPQDQQFERTAECRRQDLHRGVGYVKSVYGTTPAKVRRLLHH